MIKILCSIHQNRIVQRYVKTYYIMNVYGNRRYYGQGGAPRTNLIVGAVVVVVIIIIVIVIYLIRKHAADPAKKPAAPATPEIPGSIDTIVIPVTFTRQDMNYFNANAERVGNLQYGKKPTVDDCETTCKAEPLCDGYTWHDSTLGSFAERCIGFSGNPVTLVPSVHHKSGLRDKPPVTPVVNFRRQKMNYIFASIDRPGNIQFGVRTNENNCEQACSADIKCNAYTWNGTTQGGRCVGLTGDPITLSPSENHFSGIRDKPLNPSVKFDRKDMNYVAANYDKATNLQYGIKAFVDDCEVACAAAPTCDGYTWQSPNLNDANGGRCIGFPGPPITQTVSTNHISGLRVK